MTPISDLLYLGIAATPSVAGTFHKQILQPFHPGSGASAAATNSAVMASAYAPGASQLVHLQSGSYPLSSPVTLPPGVIRVHGGVDWYPASPLAPTQAFGADYGANMPGQMVSDNTAAFLRALAPGASAPVHIADGSYCTASQIVLSPGTLIVSGALDWTPPTPLPSGFL